MPKALSSSGTTLHSDYLQSQCPARNNVVEVTEEQLAERAAARGPGLRLVMAGSLVNSLAATAPDDGHTARGSAREGYFFV
jgi:hypothetical protein